MTKKRKAQRGFFGSVQKYLLAGMLTLIPLWVTWLVFRFILGQLSNVGRPWVVALSKAVQPWSDPVAQALLEPWFQNTLAVVITVIALYLLGWLATLVAGKKLIAAIDALIHRIPLVKKIYGATKTLVAAMQQKPGNVQRVVLIEFPTPEMKTVGFVTRILRDDDTGEELAAVYVPTTPNPTSGYLEIVPLERVVSTNWTMDEAMTFIISGGTVAPDSLNYRKSAAPQRPHQAADAATPKPE